MEALGWAVAAGLLVVTFISGLATLRARRRQDEAARALVRLDLEQARILEGLVLAEEASSRILTPGELAGTVEKVTKEAVDLLGAQGVCVLIRPPDDQDEPTALCWGRIPDGMDDAGRPVHPQPGQGFGTVLSIPIRLKDSILGEFRVAEYPGKPLNLREVHVVRLLAQLVAIAAQYRIQRRALERAEEDKRRFILATTHDLRSPVTTIEQLTQVLREGYAGQITEKQMELLDKIHGRADHLLELLSDLLNLAMEDQELGQMRQVTPVSLSSVFDKQVEASRVACESRGIEIEAHRPDSPLMRMAAQGDLENILGNLLSNAVKYTPRGGRIEVRLEDSPGGVSFRVSDTGIGIPKESLHRLFTEYFRASNARLMERHGTGLGLALVQKLVRKYGGRIRIDSTEGKGTVVEALLPPE
jgi:signal transduction histidine kinase